MDYFIHQSQGRMRVRVPALRRHLLRAKRLTQNLERLPGVRKVRLNGVTGSIVISYDAQHLNSQTILKVFHQEQLLSNVHGFPRAPRRLTHSPHQLDLEQWLGETLQDTSRTVFRSLIEMAVSKGGQMILRKILG